MRLETLNRVEGLEAGDILTSESKDTITITMNRKEFRDCVVREIEYSEEKQDYVPAGQTYYLTYNEIARDYNI